MLEFLDLGFVCFLVGRFSGAGLLARFAAHKVLGLYGALNVAITLLVFCKLGWLSVACVFLSYFFMSIMFPTVTPAAPLEVSIRIASRPSCCASERWVLVACAINIAAMVR